MQKGQGFIEYLFVLVLILIVLIAVYAVLKSDGDSGRWECDTKNHIGWEREYQYSHTQFYTVYNHVTKSIETKSYPVYEWERIRELEEKEYAIHCLGEGE